MNQFQCISVDEAQNLLNGEDCLVLDYRDVNAYRAGHVENALHVHDDLMKSLISKGDKNKPVIIYCYHGHSSQHLAEAMANFGFANVYSVDGGFESWRPRLGKA